MAKAKGTPWIDDDSLLRDRDLFLDRLTCLYGPSDTGKSVFTRGLLELLGRSIPEGTFFLGTDRDYSEIPKAYVHEIVTKDMLQAIWDRQDAKTSIYRRANRPEVLMRLARRVPDDQLDARIRRVEELCASEQAKLGESAACDRFVAKCSELICELCKTHVELHKPKYAAMKLSEDEEHSSRFLRFNPRHLVCFDDVTSQLKKLQKLPILCEYFFRARHRFITVVVGLHDETSLDPDLRKNAHISFFMTTNVLLSFFRRDVMGIPREIKRAATEVAGDRRAFEGFHKIIYFRGRSLEDYPLVRVRSVRIPRGQLVFGSRNWRKLGNEVVADGTMDPANQFASEFLA